MDTKLFMQRVKELEQTEKNYIELKNFMYSEVKKIYENLDEVQIILKKISPQLKLTAVEPRHYNTKNSTKIDEKKLELSKIYTELMEDKMQDIDVETLSNRLGLVNNSIYSKYLPLFKSLPGINVTRNGKRKSYFYIKPKGEVVLGDYFPQKIVEKIIQEERG